MYIKKHAYARNGVQEYLVALMYEKLLNWFVLKDGVYDLLKPDHDGLIKSQIFPGLWL